MAASILDRMDAYDIAAEVRMERQVHGGSFLLLEGMTDILRFGKFLDAECSTVNCWGKNNLIGAMEIINSSNTEGVLALADADFDRLIQSARLSIDNIIFSEFHDFDLDCAASGVLDIYLKEVADGEKLKAIAGADEALVLHMKAIYPISCARLANEKGLTSLPLAKVDWECCYIPYSTNLSRYIERAARKLSLAKSDIDDIIAIIRKEEGENHNLFQVTNGHDLCISIGLSLRGALGCRKIAHTTGDEVERHLRLAYSHEIFSASKTNAHIKKWQEANAPFRILREFH